MERPPDKRSRNQASGYHAALAKRITPSTMARTRDRLGSRGLLPRMEAIPLKKGTLYRYHPVGGKPISLGHDKAAAIRAVLDLLGHNPDAGTLRHIWQQFQQHSPRWRKYAASTQADYKEAWAQIEPRLGHMRPPDIDTPIIAHYVHKERATAPKRANTEKALLSVLFDYAITIGEATSNPAKNVPLHALEARRTLPQQQAVGAFLQWLYISPHRQRHVIAAMAEFASLAGNRRIEIRSLEWSAIDTSARLVITMRAKQRASKRGAVAENITISARLANVIQRLQNIREERGGDCAWVFPNENNNPYSDAGFKTIWQRTMREAIEAGIITAAQRFTFHSLRSLYATEHKRQHGQLPDLHANPATTASIYDRSQAVPRSAL